MNVVNLATFKARHSKFGMKVTVYHAKLMIVTVQANSIVISIKNPKIMIIKQTIWVTTKFVLYTVYHAQVM